MKLYIDFDGIIIDTWPSVLKEYYKKYSNCEVEEYKLRELFKDLNWDLILNNSRINYTNIKVLKKFNNYEIAILTKINSLSEGKAKEKFLKNMNIDIKLKTVDIDEKKSEIVDAAGNILIDDDIKNLIEWKEKGGCAILYSKNKDGKDSDGIINKEFPIIYELEYEYIIELLT